MGHRCVAERDFEQAAFTLEIVHFFCKIQKRLEILVHWHLFHNAKRLL